MINILILLITFLSLFFSQSISAQLPNDPLIVHGHAHFDVAGNHMTITNTPNTILNWQSFSIGSQDSVYFQQQDTASQVLNRVIGNDPSHILGNLSSNGHIWLVNPYGVLFGPNARIDVAGLVASTLDISNIDFLASRNQFYSTNNLGEVRNQGDIQTTLGGRVWLVGNQVKNEGVIQTPSGQIALAAGNSIELVDSGAPNVVVRIKAPENQTVNLGSLIASNGGNIDLHGSIVNQEGIVRANSLSTDTAGRIILTANQISLAANSETQADKGLVQIQANTTLNSWGKVNAENINFSAQNISQQGEIIAQGGNVNLNATGVTELYGLVDVSNLSGVGGNIHVMTEKLQGTAGGALRADGNQGGHIRVEGFESAAFSSMMTAVGTTQGGHIEITGDRLFLLNAVINASSGEQGGKIHLGGGWQGGGELQHAREVFIGKGSEINANGGLKGGEIAVWSTQRSDHFGSLLANEGGRIELSSQGQIYQTGDIQVGKGGTVLFDPKNLIITDKPPSSLDVVWRLTSDSLNSSGQTTSDSFGSSIALSGNRLAVGALGDASNIGAVWLFDGAGINGNLTWAAKVVPDNSNNNLQFGFSVALDGNYLAVGAPNDPSNGNTLLSQGNPGAVYIYDNVNAIAGRHDQAPRHKLKFNDVFYDTSLQTGHQTTFSYGRSIALQSGILVVSAPEAESVFVHKVADLVGNNDQPLIKIKGCDSSYDQCNSNPNSNWIKFCNGDTTCDVANSNRSATIKGFGRSISLDNEGGSLRLAVGAAQEHCNDGSERCGAVFLYDLGAISNLTVQTEPRVISAIGSDLSVSVIPNQVTFAAGKEFGDGVSLDNGFLVVKESSLSSPIYLFENVYSNPTLKRTLSKSDFLGLSANDAFSSALLLDASNDRLFVGYNDYSNGNATSGIVYLLTGVINSTNSVLPPVFFGDTPASGTSYITPATLKTQLDQGGNVTLQANNDIVVESPVIVNSEGAGGDLVLQAGRNITFIEGISTNSGDLTVVAGDPGANPSDKDPGTPTLRISSNVNLNVGDGRATLAAMNGNFINNNGDSAITGRWNIYADAFNTSIEGFSIASFNRHFNQVYVPGSVPDYARSGNWFLYQQAPLLFVGAGVEAITYNDTIPVFKPVITGFLPGDGLDNANISGTPVWSIAGDYSTSSKPVKGAHDVVYTNGLVSEQGYQFADNTSSIDELTVNAKTLVASNFTATSKIYDGNPSTDVDGSSSILGKVETDIVTLTGKGSFDDKNAGNDKRVTINYPDVLLGGVDSGNYKLANFDSITTTANISPKVLTAGNFVAVNKIYNDKFDATLVNGSGSSNEVISGDNVTLVGGIGTFKDKNVGTNIPITITGVSLEGADSKNYLLGDIQSTTANILPATLTHKANPTTRFIGTELSGFTGTFRGFEGDDNLQNDVSGQVVWKTSANNTSLPGSYPINAEGITARNYILVPAESNKTALTLTAFNPNIRQGTTDTSIQGTNTALLGTKAILDSASEGKVADVTAYTTTSMGSGFSRISLANMSREDMLNLIDFRRNFKEKLFADAIYELEIDPRLSDVPVCTNLSELDLGTCRLSNKQHEELKSYVIQKKDSKRIGKYKTKVASLPEIERKFIVVFGIDQYTDKAIPSLDNAISDANAVSQLFADKLGYEVQVIKNATRAEIIKAINQLAVNVEINDSVVVYFAGHGYLNRKAGAGYWIPADASARDPSTWISNDSISEMLTGIQSRQMVLISDSCYSGSLTNEQSVEVSRDVKPIDILTKRSVVVMASGGDEPVADEGKNGHSIFAWHLMEALQSVDSWKIGTNIFERIQTDVMKSFPQTPQYGAAISAGHQVGGDYLFEFRQLERAQ